MARSGSPCRPRPRRPSRPAPRTLAACMCQRVAEGECEGMPVEEELRRSPERREQRVPSSTGTTRGVSVSGLYGSGWMGAHTMADHAMPMTMTMHAADDGGDFVRLVDGADAGEMEQMQMQIAVRMGWKWDWHISCV
ncbi:hypothetical protein K439DRAFT_1625405 [Ramaria rubella]|nr:hypothetical protein K439DRAFT_1625405 [Ramaria rubella]